MAGRFTGDPRGGLVHVFAGRIANSQRKRFALAVGRRQGRAVDADAVKQLLRYSSASSHDEMNNTARGVPLRKAK